jgi:hypothetical protein
MRLIESKTLGTAQASIEFTSIPGTFTDLVVVCSIRGTTSVAVNANLVIQFNGSSANLSTRWLFGDGSGVSSGTTTTGYVGNLNGSTSTSNTFSSNQIYIPNYTASTNKSYSVDAVVENNATASGQTLVAGLWSNTAPITSLLVRDSTGTNLDTGSMVSLYGVLKGSDGIVTTSP